MKYEHVFLDGEQAPFPAGKAVGIGKNYRASLDEPAGPAQDYPTLFMKPPCCLTPLSEQVRLPDYSPCYYEVELAVLIGADLRGADLGQAEKAIAGYAIALDLTLKELLDDLKQKQKPWELAKAFDSSCPLSPFARPEQISSPGDTRISLSINGETRQDASTRLMIINTVQLISMASNYFSLSAGDVVLTGTPQGAGPLLSGSHLTLSLDNSFEFSTSVL